MDERITRAKEVKEAWSIKSPSIVYGDLKGNADTHHRYNQPTAIPRVTEPRQLGGDSG